jgi:hypothetical protein
VRSIYRVTRECSQTVEVERHWTESVFVTATCAEQATAFAENNRLRWTEDDGSEREEAGYGRHTVEVGDDLEAAVSDQAPPQCVQVQDATAYTEDQWVLSVWDKDGKLTEEYMPTEDLGNREVRRVRPVGYTAKLEKRVLWGEASEQHTRAEEEARAREVTRD